MKWIVPVAVAMVCCVAPVEAAVTLEQLEAQNARVWHTYQAWQAAHRISFALNQESVAAFENWQSYRSRAIWHFARAEYEQGDFWTWQAQLAQWEYDRLLAEWTTAQTETERLWNVFQAEMRRFEALADQYRRQ